MTVVESDEDNAEMDDAAVYQIRAKFLAALLDFLFLWDSARHFCAKSQFTDRFLKLLGEKPLGQGKTLTVEGYQRFLAICDASQPSPTRNSHNS